jgi:hypothetical protein
LRRRRRNAPRVDELDSHGARLDSLGWRSGVHMRAVMAAMIVVVLGACGAAVPPVHGKGGPAWTELTSEHFTVWTDGDPANVRELMREMEYLREVVSSVMFPSTPASARTLVIVLRDDDELAEFSPTGEPRPYAMSAHPPLRQPLIVLSEFSNRDPRNLRLAHELTHVISFGVVHYQPRWFAEGMAEFFETVRLDPDAATAVVGNPPEEPVAHLEPTAQLFQWRDISSDEEHHYSTAWALFTFLVAEHANELVQFTRLLDRSELDGDEMTEQMARLWGEGFRSLPLGELDGRLALWLRTGRHLVLHVTMPHHNWPIAERALGDADTYAIRAALRIELGKKEQARPDVNAAIALEPNHVLGRLLGVAIDQKMVTVEQARALVAAHPDDWRAWWLVTLAIEEVDGDQKEYDEARAKTCGMVAHNAALAPPRPLCPARENAAR